MSDTMSKVGGEPNLKLLSPAQNLSSSALQS